MFYNPMIRFVFLGAIKFNTSALIIFKKDSSREDQIITASLLFVSISLIVPIVLTRVVYKNKDCLHEEKNEKTVGTLYMGRRVVSSIDERRVWIYPASFFLRRTIFAIVSVFLFDHPNMQMIVHQFLTMATLIYISFDNRMFDDQN